MQIKHNTTVVLLCPYTCQTLLNMSTQADKPTEQQHHVIKHWSVEYRNRILRGCHHLQHILTCFSVVLFSNKDGYFTDLALCCYNFVVFIMDNF